MVPTFQPPPEFQLAVQRSIAAGKELFYDYTRYSTQELACNGSTRQTYRIHMNGVRSLKAFDFSFVDEDLLANPALDKNEISSSKGLREWFIQIGNLVTPSGMTGFLNGPANPETLLISQIKGNYLSAVGELDLPSLSDYQNKFFSAGFSYPSIDVSSSAALSFVGTDSIMEMTTIHEAGQQPSTNCRMVFQYSENVTLSISTLVDVI
ncbi:hypothetical protein DFS34DRAFT_304190 [Phlyctochytrium arcticum]|nr:hypothetical protein DFS34DRAFT_304190 [Phlyctochytrium arcticum]